MGEFKAKVDDQVLLVERRLKATFQEATKRVIFRAQTPVAEGGRMPVDFGFLRNSLRVSMDGLPSGPGDRSDAPDLADPSWRGEQEVVLAIAGAEPGDRIFAGWTASYARIQNARNGYLEDAALAWQGIVSDVAAEVKARVR